MTPPVFVAPPDILAGAAAGSALTITGDEARHAVTVRRLRPGDPVHIVDGLGTRAVGVVAAVAGPAALDVAVASVVREPEPALRLTAVLALVKGDRMETAVEMLTELGVCEIIPWQATRSIVRPGGGRSGRIEARLAGTARAAAKQSRRAFIPAIGPVAGSARVEEVVGAAGCSVVLHESARRSIGELSVPRRGGAVLLIGPEGGLTEEELTRFEAAGAEAVRLSPHVLRTATAAAAGAAVLLQRGGCWR